MPEDQTANLKYYIDVLVLTNLRELVRKKRPNLWENYSRNTHKNNALAYSTNSTKQSLADKLISMLEYPSCSPVHTLWNFHMFPKRKIDLR